MATREASEHSVARTRREAREFSSWFSVVRAYEECARRYAALLGCFELTVSQFDALVSIKALGSEAMPKTVAKRLLVTRANVSGLLRRLEEQGLILVAPNEADGRSVRCSLTAEGLRVTAQAQAAAARFVHAQLAPFPTPELDAIEHQMRAMHAHLLTLDPVALAVDDESLRTRRR
ncbi:MAG: MarR family transcriptional regulator [Pseudomonadota bacterium]